MFCDQSGVDMAGLNFCPGSPRCLEPRKALEISGSKKQIRTVAIFADSSRENIYNVRSILNPDFIQFHGSETPDFCREFKPYIKAFRIKTIQDIKTSLDFLPEASFLLFDAWCSLAAGGTGKTIPGELLDLLAKTVPLQKVIIAGGISIDNIQSTGRIIAPAGFDLCSSLEENRGIKSIKRIENFLKIFREIYPD